VRNAERCYERTRPDEEPTWLGLYTEPELAADLGRSLRNVGECKLGTRLITQAVNGYEPWRIRSRCLRLVDLTLTHIASRDYDQVVAVGRDAIRSAAEVSSIRPLKRLSLLQRQIRPLRPSSLHLAELDDRITDLLARRSGHGDKGSAT
jgi:hypothetical protein